MPDPKPSEITSRPPQVELAGDRGVSTQIVYVGRDDRLYIRSASLSSIPTFLVGGRLLLPDGTIRPLRFDVISGATAFADRTFELAEGHLLSVAAHGGTAMTIPRQVWVEVGILRGRLADLQIGQVLFRGYLSAGKSLGWPAAHLETDLEDPGAPALGTAADPAAGAEALWTVTTNTVARHKTLRVTFVTDATVIDRFVAVEIVDSGAVVAWRGEFFALQPASTTRIYNWAVGGQHGLAANQGEHVGYIPAVHLREAQRIRTNTINLQAGDNYGAPTFQRDEWFSE